MKYPNSISLVPNAQITTLSPPSWICGAYDWISGFPLFFNANNIPGWYDVVINGTRFHNRICVRGVGLLINDTETTTDDYVPIVKAEGEPKVRLAPRNVPAGASDNHIPMTVRLFGPPGYACKVLLSDTGGGDGVGDVTIKMPDGSAYPVAGVTVTVGTDLNTYLYGTTASKNLEDVTIEARSDQTGSTVVGHKELTVIGISDNNMIFRGSAQQGTAFTSTSQAQLSSWNKKIVGLVVYPSNPKALFNQMEIDITVSPDVIIPNIKWSIQREGAMCEWHGENNQPHIKHTILNGWENWTYDGPGDVHAYDGDLVQDAASTHLFSVDTPTVSPGAFINWVCVSKAKFREWVEVKIGNNWYVCSPYKKWKSAQHLCVKDETTGWEYDMSKVNEIVEGTYENFCKDWVEE